MFVDNQTAVFMNECLCLCAVFGLSGSASPSHEHYWYPLAVLLQLPIAKVSFATLWNVLFKEAALHLFCCVPVLVPELGYPLYTSEPDGTNRAQCKVSVLVQTWLWCWLGGNISLLKWNGFQVVFYEGKYLKCVGCWPSSTGSGHPWSTAKTLLKFYHIKATCFCRYQLCVYFVCE